MVGNDFYVDSSNTLEIDVFGVKSVDNYGPIMYGTFKSELVAVKQIQSIAQETVDFIRSLDHENVANFLQVEQHGINPIT